MLKVSFIGEGGVDDGGPRREFFCILMKVAFSDSGLFSGWPENVVPLHSIEAVADNRFYVIGKMISTSIVQGGQPPLCFAKAVAEYIIFDEIKSRPCLEDIPDYDIRQSLKELQKARTTNEVQVLLQTGEYDFRFQCGYSKPLSVFDLRSRDEMVQCIWLHFVYFAIHAELDQLRKGIRETLQMELPICTYPEEVYSLLVSSPHLKVTEGFFLEEVVIHYSDQGSNRRTAEEAVVLHWSDYIMEVSERKTVSIEDILQFITGSRRIPAVGFEKPLSIAFTEVDQLPTVSTCALRLTFPRCFANISHERFQEMMDTCILGSFGFGNV